MVAIWRHNKSHREGCKVKIEAEYSGGKRLTTADR